MFKRILVAYDGSEGAQAALRMGIGLAKSPGTELYSISVEEHLHRYAATIGEVEDARERIDERCRAWTSKPSSVRATSCRPSSTSPGSGVATCCCWAPTGTAASSSGSSAAPP